MIPALTGEKLDRRKNIFVQNEAVIGKKPVEGVGETSNLAHRQIFFMLRKKTSKKLFCLGPSTL